MSNCLELTDANFEAEVLKSDIPVLVDFWAIWCGPCKLVGPVVEEMAKDYDGKLKVGKLDVDKNSTTASRFAIMSIPTLLFFKNGEVVETVIGAVPKRVLAEKVDKILK